MSLTDGFTWCLCVFHIRFYVVVVCLPQMFLRDGCVFDRHFYVVVVCL